MRTAPAQASQLDAVAALAEQGRLAEYVAELHLLAGRCEAGDSGRRALLLLAAVHVDARYPGSDPDSAARLAAHYLALPDGDPTDRPLAASLYTVALDRGAVPLSGVEAGAAPEGLASRFSDCGALEPSPARWVWLPNLEGESREAALLRLEAQRDSLAARLDTVKNEREALERRNAELEAELQRIRRLLAGPDTTRAPRRR